MKEAAKMIVVGLGTFLCVGLFVAIYIAYRVVTA